MAWNDTPKAFVFMSDTQPAIQENFASFKTAFAIDHYDINDASFSGLHKKLNMIRQEVDEVQNSINASTIGFYDKTLNNADQLYLKTSTRITPITYTSGNTRTLPSGIVMKTGFVNIKAFTVSIQITPEIVFDTPFTAAPYAILLGQSSVTARNNIISSTAVSMEYSYESVTASSFKIYYATSVSATLGGVGRPSTFFYIALGV